MIAIAITLLALDLPIPTGADHVSGNVAPLDFLRDHTVDYVIA